MQQQNSADKQLLVCKLNAFPLTRNNYKIPRIGIKLEKSVLEAIYYCLLPGQYINMQIKLLCNKIKNNSFHEVHITSIYFISTMCLKYNFKFSLSLCICSQITLVQTLSYERNIGMLTYTLT